MSQAIAHQRVLVFPDAPDWHEIRREVGLAAGSSPAAIAFAETADSLADVTAYAEELGLEVVVSGAARRLSLDGTIVVVQR